MLETYFQRKHRTVGKLKETKGYFQKKITGTFIDEEMNTKQIYDLLLIVVTISTKNVTGKAVYSSYRKKF